MLCLGYIMVAKKPYIFESRYWPIHIERYHIHYIPNMVVIKYEALQ